MDNSWGRNVRAALVLKGVSVDAAARELNLSRKTLERTLRGERTPRDWETSRLAETIGVPRWFIEEGLRRFDEDAADADDMLVRARKLARLVEAESVRLFSEPTLSA